VQNEATGGRRLACSPLCGRCADGARSGRLLFNGMSPLRGVSPLPQGVSSSPGCLLFHGVSPPPRGVSSSPGCLLLPGVSPPPRGVSSSTGCLLPGVSPPPGRSPLHSHIAAPAPSTAPRSLDALFVSPLPSSPRPFLSPPASIPDAAVAPARRAREHVEALLHRARVLPRRRPGGGDAGPQPRAGGGAGRARADPAAGRGSAPRAARRAVRGQEGWDQSRRCAV
jgi:hypothetical protein